MVLLCLLFAAFHGRHGERLTRPCPAPLQSDSTHHVESKGSSRARVVTSGCLALLARWGSRLTMDGSLDLAALRKLRDEMKATLKEFFGDPRSARGTAAMVKVRGDRCEARAAKVHETRRAAGAIGSSKR